MCTLHIKDEHVALPKLIWLTIPFKEASCGNTILEFYFAKCFFLHWNPHCTVSSYRRGTVLLTFVTTVSRPMEQGESSRNIYWMKLTESPKLEKNVDKEQNRKLAFFWFFTLHYSQIIAFWSWANQIWKIGSEETN